MTEITEKLLRNFALDEVKLISLMMLLKSKGILSIAEIDAIHSYSEELLEKAEEVAEVNPKLSEGEIMKRAAEELGKL